jgi:tetratricopeptide (TPR) repeat protein|tara:strand:+ start:480 stop:917 length:438 start_codon:yes stop_codon:yes gene_type:complete
LKEGGIQMNPAHSLWYQCTTGFRIVVIGVVAVVMLATSSVEKSPGVYRDSSYPSGRDTGQIQDERDADFYFNLGNDYNESGKYKEAIESFKRVIRINPDNAEAQFNLGLAYINMNYRNSALVQYEILKSLNTEYANELLDITYSI